MSRYVAGDSMLLGRRARYQEFAICLCSSFLVLGVMSLSSDHWASSTWWAIAFLILAGVTSIFVPAGKLFRNRLPFGILLAATGFGLLFSLDLLFRRWEVGSPEVPFLGVIESWLFQMGGIDSTWSNGLLNVDHGEGAVSIRLSPEKTAIRWMAGFVVAWLLLRTSTGRLPSFRALFVMMGVVWFWLVLRLTIFLWVYIDSREVLLTSGGGERLEFLCGFFVTGLSVVALGVLVGCLTPADAGLHAVASTFGSSDKSFFPGNRGWIRRTFVLPGLVFVCSFMAFVVLLVRVPGPAGKGRVLIDDRLCGQWEPAARLLDREWFGDFSTYSFSSVAEWLGTIWSVDVNAGREYDSELLANYDVLILKTPEKQLTRNERNSILDWTKNGGGLLLVGDHTNLLGMNSQLNLLSVPAGIRFRYDAVTPRVFGGFNRYRRQPGAIHPAVQDVDELMFMTSCSLELDSKATPLLITGDCQLEPFDYANSSFFGSHRSYPETEFGPAVLCAVAEFGNGKVAAFTDSTVWSSFAIFSHNRDVLLNGLVNELNLEPSAWQVWARWFGVAGLLALGIWVCLALANTNGGVLYPVAISVTAFWLATWTSHTLNHRLNSIPESSVDSTRVNFLWEGGRCAFPSTLGSLGDLAASDSFDTMFVSMQRMGIVPKIAWKYQEALESEPDAIVIIRPIWTPPKIFMKELKSYVADGGHVFLLDDLGMGNNSSAGNILKEFGIDLIRHGADTGEGIDSPHVHLGKGTVASRSIGQVEVGRIPFGQGSIVYSYDAARFSRDGMGHCFSVPWEDARYVYEAVYTVFDPLFGIAPQERRNYGIIE